MLAIRMQRTGRKGHAQFRLIVQESRRSPSSGNIVAALGHYDPHTKAITLDKEKAATYLNNGAQPSPRIAVLFKNEGITLPSWVKLDDKKQKNIKNVEKLRRNQPKEEAPAEEPAAEAPEAPAVAEAITVEEAPAVEAEVAAAEEGATETPAEA